MVGVISAFRRHTLRIMQDIASDMGFTALSSDTYSLFLDSDNSQDDRIHQFIAACKEKLRIVVNTPQPMSASVSDLYGKLFNKWRHTLHYDLE